MKDICNLIPAVTSLLNDQNPVVNALAVETLVNLTATFGQEILIHINICKNKSDSFCAQTLSQSKQKLLIKKPKNSHESPPIKSPTSAAKRQGRSILSPNERVPSTPRPVPRRNLSKSNTPTSAPTKASSPPIDVKSVIAPNLTSLTSETIHSCTMPVINSPLPEATKNLFYLHIDKIVLHFKCEQVLPLCPSICLTIGKRSVSTHR